MPPGAKKRRAAKKKKESSLEKPSLDTHVDDSSSTALPSPGSVDKEGSDSGSDIVSPRAPEAPDLGAAASKEEGKEETLSSGASTVAAMDTSENGAKAAEAEEGPVAPAHTGEVADAPPAEDPKAVEAFLTPPDSISEVPVSKDEGVAVEHVCGVPSAEEPEVTETYLTPPDSSYEVPLTTDGGGVTVEHVEAADASHAAGPADAGVEPVVLTEIPRDVPLDDKVHTTIEPTEIPREVLDNQSGAAAAVPADPPVSTSEEAVPPVCVSEVPVAPVAPEAGCAQVEDVEPSISVHPSSKVKEGEPITSAAYLEQPPQASTETQAHIQESRGLGAEAVLPPQAARRASWLNCCGLCDIFSGNR